MNLLEYACTHLFCNEGLVVGGEQISSEKEVHNFLFIRC